jgi:hypothetical protein
VRFLEDVGEGGRERERERERESGEEVIGRWQSRRQG